MMREFLYLAMGIAGWLNVFMGVYFLVNNDGKAPSYLIIGYGTIILALLLEN